MARPSDQIRIGAIGMGARGGLAHNWHSPDGRSVVVAGADVNADLHANFKKTYGESAFTTTDYREMLERSDIEAVAVLSPDFCHEEHAVAAMEAGKHVYCEKPMAITIEGCDNMIDASKRTGKRLMIGFNMRYMSIFRVMKDVIDSGQIGEIKAAWVRHFVGLAATGISTIGTVSARTPPVFSCRRPLTTST